MKRKRKQNRLKQQNPVGRRSQASTTQISKQARPLASKQTRKESFLRILKAHKDKEGELEKNFSSQTMETPFWKDMVSMEASKKDGYNNQLKRKKVLTHNANQQSHQKKKKRRKQNSIHYKPEHINEPHLVMRRPKKQSSLKERVSLLFDRGAKPINYMSGLAKSHFRGGLGSGVILNKETDNVYEIMCKEDLQDYRLNNSKYPKELKIVKDSRAIYKKQDIIEVSGDSRWLSFLRNGSSSRKNSLKTNHQGSIFFIYFFIFFCVIVVNYIFILLY